MSSTPQVDIPGCGTVRGIQADTQSTVAKFLNIPYATVTERWRPAVNAAPWIGVRDASVQGPVCPQPRTDNPLVSPNGITEVSEKDCLNLNIFAPQNRLNTSQPLIPVMVWIHGGAYRDGGNAMKLYDGTKLVAESMNIDCPVIVVTINYRLNFFGFLSSPELVQDVQSDSRLSPNEKSVGNWGLLDQKIALEWVRDHIAAFGGDPEKITAFGESAGAASIGYHMSIPAHHGLFQRAIMQSGAATSLTARPVEVINRKDFIPLCQYFEGRGVIDPNLSPQEKLEILRGIPAEELTAAGDDDRVFAFLPTVDDVLIHGDVQRWIHDPARYDPGVKAVMLGDCPDQGTTLVAGLGESSYVGWPGKLARHFPPGKSHKSFAHDLGTIYGVPESNPDAERISADMISDAIFLYPIHATTVALMGTEGYSRPNDPLRLVRYRFDRPLSIPDLRCFGTAHHAIDLPFVFGPDLFTNRFSDADKELSREVQRIWIRFAHGQVDDAEAELNAIEFTAEGDIRKTPEQLNTWTRLSAEKLALWQPGEQ
ncbi:MAG: Alpha/Beta hydrolase protein [Benniella sp.]|nr:MAG: Alpha/Beta hydrolase protein [Benniella sp.]